MTDLTRESLAAALRSCGTEDDSGLFAFREDKIDAILDALPSPAPEPPPREDLDVPRVVPDAFPSQQLTDRYGQPVTRFGFHLEGRAAQPAPDPEAIRLLAELTEASENVRYSDALDPQDDLHWEHWHKVTIEARSFLNARSAPEEASE